ncbi:hypothetical protein Taro_028749 [Colocasia esculenta]|uniref:Uncharacterized protein n=1 Tax=Colocasia esculenta TaxID=4460 RepID=A0A843VC32_COLES|nr:hypothetical protein [Colocasia esculenta]
MAGGGSTHKELLTAQTRLWNYALGYIRPLSLRVAVQLGIPEAVHGHGGPISLSDLASTVGVAEASKVLALRRLMRALSHFGCFERSVIKAAAGEGDREAEEEEEEVYAPTPFSSCLVKDSPTTAAPILLLLTYPLIMSSWHSKAAWFRGEHSESAYGFEAAHGGTVWELLSREAEFNSGLNNATACDSRWAIALLTKEHPEVFHGLTSLVDVGGGNGTSAKVIKDAFPDMRCTVLELGHVIADSPAVEGVDFVEGDMFEHSMHRSPAENDAAATAGGAVDDAGAERCNAGKGTRDERPDGERFLRKWELPAPGAGGGLVLLSPPPSICTVVHPVPPFVRREPATCPPCVRREPATHAPSPLLPPAAATPYHRAVYIAPALHAATATSPAPGSTRPRPPCSHEPRPASLPMPRERRESASASSPRPRLHLASRARHHRRQKNQGHRAGEGGHVRTFYRRTTTKGMYYIYNNRIQGEISMPIASIDLDRLLDH